MPSMSLPIGSVSLFTDQGSVSFPSVGGISTNPASLDLQFWLMNTLDPRITFTRASSGTYWDADGVLQTASTDVARLTHDPATGESLGLLIEPAATNLLTYSQDFGNVAWGKSGISVSGQEINFTSSGSSQMIQAIAVSPGVFTVSFVASSGTKSGVFVRVFGSSTGNGGGNIVLTPDTLPYSVTVDASAFTGGVFYFGFDCQAAAGADALSQASGTIFVDNIQVETGTTATSPIYTEASQVTRAADVAVMTGTNFSDWYNASEGTFVVEAMTPEVGSSSPLAYTVSDGTDNNRTISCAATQFHFLIVSGGGISINADMGAFVNNQFSKVAGAYAEDDFAASLDGSAVSTSSSGSPPVSPDRINFGATSNSTVFGVAYLKSLTYYPARLSNATLQALTGS